MKHFIRRSTVVALSVAALSLAARAPARAQQTQQASHGPRWLGLLGCWAVAPAGTAPDAQLDGRIVCVTPTADPNAADISAIAEGKVLTRDRIDASGRSSPLEPAGCTGTQRANWSGDERRIYLQSSVTCNGITTSMSALLALTVTGNWIDVRRVWTGQPDSGEVHVARYRDIGLPRDVPPDIANTLRQYAMSIESGRIAASVPVGTPAIIEASKLADPTIVSAWLTESGQRFALDSREWRELADAGVPAQVRDAMDETVHPSVRTDRGYYEQYGNWGTQASASWDQGTGMRKIGGRTPTYDAYYNPWGYGLGYGTWPYGLGFGLGYLQPFSIGLGIGFGDIGFGSSLGYLYGYRGSVTGYRRPNVLVLKDNAVATQGQTLDPIADDATTPKKTPGTVIVGGVPVATFGSSPSASRPGATGGTTKP